MKNTIKIMAIAIFIGLIANSILAANAIDINTLINNIAFNVSQSHEYKLGTFDCTQFSKELKTRLNEMGLNAYCVAGWYYIYGDDGRPYKKALHTWVEVNVSDQIIPVEATTGTTIDPEAYKGYNVIRRNLCW